ncbi:MAG: hypothetical protein JNM70_03420 [Anaerolineae bacterium]|nr:hypothetical protein [Anaerolineae bacterium]
MSRLPGSHYIPTIVTEERSCSLLGESPIVFQPFVARSILNSHDALILDAARHEGRWTQILTAEQTALTLGQMTSAGSLPWLRDTTSLIGLLDYHVFLRDHLDGCLVDEIVNTLANEHESKLWTRIENGVYICVIGAGVAACIDTTPNLEVLYLRYAEAIIDAIAAAQFERDLPRSVRGLQLTLWERLDALFDGARLRLLHWLSSTSHEHSPGQNLDTSS